MDLPVTLGTHLPHTLQLFCPSTQKGGAETESCPQLVAVTSTDFKKYFPKKGGDTIIRHDLIAVRQLFPF